MRSSCHQALHAGCAFSAAAVAFITMSLKEIFVAASLPRCPAEFSASLASHVRSMSTSVVR